MTVSDTHADTIRETRRERCERIFNVDACVRLARSTPDYYDLHGNYLPDVAWLLNETRADLEREREAAANIKRDYDDVFGQLLRSHGERDRERARADRAEAALRDLADEAARAVTEPRRFHINEDERQQKLGASVARARAALSAGSGGRAAEEGEG